MNPKEAKTLYNEASALFRQAKYDEALALLARLAKEFPRDPRVLKAQELCWEKLNTPSNPITPIAVDDSAAPMNQAVDPLRLSPRKRHSPRSDPASKRRWLISSVVAAGVLALAGLYVGLKGSDDPSPPSQPAQVQPVRTVVAGAPAATAPPVASSPNPHSVAASNLPVAANSSPDSPTPQIRIPWGPDVFWGVNVVMAQVPGSDLRELAQVWNVSTIRLGLRLFELQFIQDDNDPYPLNEADLWELDRYIDLCEMLGLRVILTNQRPIGNREYHQPGGKDRRIWSDFRYHDYLVFFWQKLAERYANRGPVIAGYDIFGEPDPEVQTPLSPSDWNLLARKITTAIRQADRAHTIIVAAIRFAAPTAFDLLEPTGDDNTVYDFHFYSPWAFTGQGMQDGYGDTSPLNVTYPGNIGGEYWDKNRMLKELEPVIAFQQRYQVPILCGEFSVVRWAPSASAVKYLQDLLSICDEHKWSSLYWSFRGAEGSAHNLETEGGINDFTVVGTNGPRFQAIRPYFSRNKRWSGPMTGKPVSKPKIRFDEYHAELNTLLEQRAQEINSSHPEWHLFGRFARRAEDYFDVVRSLQPLRYDTLRDANVLILAAPQNALTAEEVTDIVRFVSEGGGLLVLGDSTLGERLNSLLVNFGMTYRQGTLASHTPLWDAQSFVVTNLNQTHFITKGIHELQANWSGVLENLGDALVLAETTADSWQDANTNGKQDPNEQIGAYAFALAKQFGKGRVLAVADNGFYDAGIMLCENRRFIVHALAWLAERQ